ncbi:MAG: protein BatD, partial [Salibacteraceae bacterium]
LPLRRRQQLRNSDVVGQRQRKANRIANQRLSEARKAMDQGAKNAFYEAVFKALYGFVGDKLNLPVSELNKANIRENLLGKQVAESTVNELIAVLDRCEMARFAPVSDTTEQAIYDQSANIIRQLEGHLK